MIDQLALRQLTEDVCCGMLGLSVSFDSDIESIAPGDSALLAARVAISGDADTTLTIVCDDNFVRRLASTMYNVDSQTLDDDEIHDAIGELANIVGGNVKGALPGETLLSLPSVGHANSLPEIDSSDVVEINGHCDGHPFSVRLESSLKSAVAE